MHHRHMMMYAKIIHPITEGRELGTTAQSAEIMECTPENIRRLAKTGALPVAAVIGRGQRLFDLAVVRQIAAQRALKKAG